MTFRDDRFYAFIVDHTSRSRSRIRRISVHKRWLKLSACMGAALMCAALYGFYGLAQQAEHLRIEHENSRLRAENEKQKQQLHNLNNRVEAVEHTTRRLVEQNGVSQDDKTELNGAGGPSLPLDTATAIDLKTRRIEQDLRNYEKVMSERATVPSIWPVDSGRLTDDFGGRFNPFGGYGTEFHTGQDIATAWGTPVAATANGTVIFSGWQSGYGQVVVIDHGGGLTTRYGHLSHVDATVGQTIKRGDIVGNVGSTGRSTGPHLHYEVRLNDEPVDPMQYLPQ
ncbi:MAG: peptidoglycan DD-metalloendopeptidase family protein [Pyrinomonadaceae bacterium]